MPISLLHRLADHDLPIAVSDGADVDALRVLSLAGHVKATIPKPVRTLGGYDQPPATVSAITALGHSMLRRFPRHQKSRATAHPSPRPSSSAPPTRSA